MECKVRHIRKEELPLFDTSIPAKQMYLHRGYRVSGTETWRIEPHGGFPALQLVYETMSKDLGGRHE